MCERPTISEEIQHIINVCVTIHLVKKFHKSLNVCATIQLVDNFHTSLNVWETKTISGYISTHH